MTSMATVILFTIYLSCSGHQAPSDFGRGHTGELNGIITGPTESESFRTSKIALFFTITVSAPTSSWHALLFLFTLLVESELFQRFSFGLFLYYSFLTSGQKIHIGVTHSKVSVPIRTLKNRGNNHESLANSSFNTWPLHTYTHVWDFGC